MSEYLVPKDGGLQPMSYDEYVAGESMRLTTAYLAGAASRDGEIEALKDAAFSESTRLMRENKRYVAEIEALRAERDCAIGMLAAWCVGVDQNGTGWDDWDEYYKDAMYRPNPIRELLDKAIAAEGKTP